MSFFARKKSYLSVKYFSFFSPSLFFKFHLGHGFYVNTMFRQLIRMIFKKCFHHSLKSPTKLTSDKNYISSIDYFVLATHVVLHFDHAFFPYL